MMYGLIALVLGLILLFFGMKISELQNELRTLEARQEEHDRKTDEDLYKAETWKAAANFRFDDDEKDIADLKSQCERFKGYIYRQTGEKV